MKKKLISVIKYLLFLALGIGLLWLVTKDQDFWSIVNDFKNANYWYILLSMLIGIISHVFRAIRWNMLINTLGHKPGTFPTFLAVMTGYFANLIVPRMGEVSRCGVLSKQQKIPFNSLFGTVVVERLFDMLCLIIILFLVVVFQFSLLYEFLNNFVLAPMSSAIDGNIVNAIIGFSILIILGFLVYYLFNKYKYLLKKLSFYSKLKDLVIGFVDGIKTIKNMKNKGMFIFHTITIWTCYVLMIYVCFFAMDSTAHLKFIDGITVMATGSLGIVAPVPGGIGAYHYIVKATMVELFNISPDISTSFAFVVHATQTLMIAIIGGLSMFLLFIFGKKKLDEEQS